VSLRGPGFEVRRRGDGVPDFEAAARRRQAFYAAMKAATLAGSDPYRLLCDSAREHLGVVGETDAFARVVLALAHDFQRETGAEVLRDPQVLPRLSEAYLRAVDELRSLDRTELNLPFLAVTPRGPAHLRREVGVADLIALARREPVDLSPPAEPAPAPEPERPKKKGWWPF
jgi:hypothetical protein